MKREEAAMGIGYLVAATTGWNDEAVDVYIHECTHFLDPEVFIIAMRNLALTWNKQSRPLMFDVRAAYQWEQRNRELEQKVLPSDTGEILTLEEGTEVARRAYRSECIRQGREPNEEIFDHWIATLANKRQARAERASTQERSDEFEQF